MSGAIDDETRCSMLNEVAALMRRGMSQADAEELVGITGVSDAARRGKMLWLPTPSEIVEQTAAIRAAWHDSEHPTRRQQMLDRE